MSAQRPASATRLLIGNDFSVDLRGDREWTTWWVQRLAWFARDGDVLVLPEPPDEAFLDYVLTLVGVDAASLRIVVPEAGDPSPLTAEQLAAPATAVAVREAIAGRRVDAVVALWPDSGVAELAQAIDAQDKLDGAAFVAQGGGALVNSKSAFRAIAGGAGVRLPPGTVCANPRAAERAILSLLERGQPAMVKHDFMSGGRGNEIVTPLNDGFRPIGARRVVELTGEPAVRRYVSESWGWLTDDGRGRAVVERFYRDSSAFFAEFEIADDAIEFGGHGELLSAPYAIGQIMPGVGLDHDTTDRLVDGGRRICEALHAIGYRGVLSADAIVTPGRDVLFTEYNGRITGSTHLYGPIARRVVGEGFGRDRVILDRVWPPEWSVDSFQSAADKLAGAGHAYDPRRRTGVILTNAYDPVYRGVMYCIVDEGPDQAWRRDRELKQLFSRTGRSPA